MGAPISNGIRRKCLPLLGATNKPPAFTETAGLGRLASLDGGLRLGRFPAKSKRCYNGLCRDDRGCFVKLTRDAILKRLEEHRDAIRGYGVRRLGLFGSQARGEASEASDLDFVVEFDRKSFDAYMDLKAYLEELFGCPVDLVLADAVKPRLRVAVVEEAIHAAGL